MSDMCGSSMQKYPVDIGRQTKRRHQDGYGNFSWSLHGLIEAVKQLRSSSAVLATIKGSLDEAVAAALFLEACKTR